MSGENEPRKRDYDYLRDIGVEGWAWEFIRRSPAYRRAWEKHGSNLIIEPDQENTLKISEKETTAAERFGLLFFR